MTPFPAHVLPRSACSVQLLRRYCWLCPPKMKKRIALENAVLVNRHPVNPREPVSPRAEFTHTAVSETPRTTTQLLIEVFTTAFLWSTFSRYCYSKKPQVPAGTRACHTITASHRRERKVMKIRLALVWFIL